MSPAEKKIVCSLLMWVLLVSAILLGIIAIYKGWIGDIHWILVVVAIAADFLYVLFGGAAISIEYSRLIDDTKILQ